MRLLLLITLLMFMLKIEKVKRMAYFENYVTSLLERFIPKSLKIKKLPAFEAVADHFENQWNSILDDTEKRLVELLLEES